LLAEFAHRCDLPAETQQLRELVAARAPHRANLGWPPSNKKAHDPAAVVTADQWKSWLARRIEAATAFAPRWQQAPDAIPATARVGSLQEARDRLKKKDFIEAWNSTVQAIEVRPFHPEAFLLLAEIAHGAGDQPKSKQCVERARALAPQWKAARK